MVPLSGLSVVKVQITSATNLPWVHSGVDINAEAGWVGGGG